MELIKSNLKGVIGSSKSGILINNLESEYKRITNSSMNYKNFKYPDLISFLNSMNDIVRLQYIGNECYVHLITNENDPQCLKKLCTLIQTTKSKKNGKKNNNIPHNIMSKAIEFDNLKISVTNDFCQTDRETNSNAFQARNSVNNNSFAYNQNQRNWFSNNSHISSSNNTGVGFSNYASYNRGSNSFYQNDNVKYPINTNSNTNPIFNEQTFSRTNLQSKHNNYQNMNSNSRNPILSSTPQTSDNKSINNHSLVSNNKVVTNQSNNIPNCSTSSSSSIVATQSSSPLNNSEVLSNKSINNTNTYHQNGTTNTVEMYKKKPIIIDWPINLDISIDILHKPVRILGIQSGYALLMVADNVLKKIYIPTNSFRWAFPGDFFLWQPPVPDTNRQKSMIDITYAVPVVSIEQVGGNIMKVRVLGLKILLEVDINDLYEFPNDINDCKKLRLEFETRQISFVRLAMVPKFVNLWNVNILSDLYFSPDSFNEDEFIFERCEKRGDFLNVMLLIRYFHSDFLRIGRREQKIFVEQLICEISNAKLGFRNEFLAMLQEKSINRSSDCDLLLPIEPNRVSLVNKMLIGCDQILSNMGEMNNGHHRNEINLERITYNDSNNSYHYFDNDNRQVMVYGGSPLYGLYKINEEFVTSRLSNMTKLRFQTAILLHVPSCSKLRNSLPKI